jgi:hypothetical protein
MNAVGVRDHHQPGAIARKALGDPRANAATGSGNNNRFVVKISVHIIFPLARPGERRPAQ